MPGSNPAGVTIYTSGETGKRARLKLWCRDRLVSSNLTSCTIYRTGVMGARLALTQEDEDRNLGAVPHGPIAKGLRPRIANPISPVRIGLGPPICRMTPDGSGTGLENRGQQCCGDRHLRPAPYGVIPQPVRDLPAKEAAQKCT